eukprot:1128321-Rhodomonas_salina.1
MVKPGGAARSRFSHSGGAAVLTRAIPDAGEGQGERHRLRQAAAVSAQRRLEGIGADAHLHAR